MTSEGHVPGAAGAPLVLDRSAPIEARCASLSDLYRVARAHRGGGDLFTRRVSDPLGSLMAAVAIRFNIHPTIVTVAGLGLALVASIFVTTQADHLHPGWMPGLLALLLWQLSYVLDCADGQVARATGKASSFGARADVLVDFLVHVAVISALATVLTQQTDLPVALLVGCAVLWPLNLFVGALARSDGNAGHSFTKRAGMVGVIKLVRDTGFILFVMGVWLLVHPQTIVFPVVAVCAFNACFLLASIGREAYMSIRSTADLDRLEGEVRP